jgi:hypothetical protein
MTNQLAYTMDCIRHLLSLIFFKVIMEKPASFTHLHALGAQYNFERWSEASEGVGDAGGRYYEVMDPQGVAVIGEWGFGEDVADYVSAASPAVIHEANEFMDAQAKRIAELEAQVKMAAKFNAPSALVADFREFIYRVVTHVPFDQAEWANQKAQALMSALKAAQDDK